MLKRLRPPSPATVLATVALFVALGGTAVAAGVVPKAKFALNAAKLQGKSAAQVSALPGPASSASALVATRTTPFSLGASDVKMFSSACQAGEKAVGGGYATLGAVLSITSLPSSDGASWQIELLNVDKTGGATGNVYAVCLK